ncbi:hypothetical protein K8S19_06490 [bacterium]|nr:hypothetical protein [bacterium]
MTKRLLNLFRKKEVIAQRLLEMRAAAGDDAGKHHCYHKTVNRYQRFILRKYYLRKRYSIFSRLLN